MSDANRPAPPASRPGLAHVDQLLVMPQSGVAAMAALLGSARHSLAIKMFTFGSEPLLDAVADAVRRGVAVRVLLNPARSSGDRANDPAMRRLLADGADAAWTNPAFAVTHEKSVVIDDARAVIATFNFMDKYFTHTRDYGVVVSDPAIVAQVAACFEADRSRTAFVPPATGPLTFSNVNARQTMAGVIDGATSSLRIQHPKFSDQTIVDRILAAHARGVHVRVLCGGHHGISDSDKLDTYSALRTLHRVGIAVRRQHKLRLHAKLILADRAVAMIGSMNIDRSAFDLRRELGVLIADPDVLATLRKQFHADWEEAPAYQAPDPLVPEHPDAEPLPRDAIGPDPDYAHD